MGTLVDLTGKTFGSWLVLRRSHRRERGRGAFWLCRCICGLEVAVVGGNLRSGISTNCGCLREPYTVAIESGSRFGAWTVIERGPKGRRSDSAFWLCECVCGKRRNVRSFNLRRLTSLSCGCTRVYDHSTYPDDDIRVYTGRFNSYKEKASRRDIDFALTLEQFVELTKQSCSYCGSPPAMPVRRERKRSASALMNGIDRIDSAKGYHLENCAPCCQACNEMKLDRTVDEFLSHVRKIAIYRMRD